MSGAIPRISVVDDPLSAPTPAPRAPRSTPRTAPSQALETPQVSLRDEATAALFARLPKSVLWALESTSFELSASDRRRGKVTRQELVGALLWSEVGENKDIAKLGGLVDAYREAAG